MDVEKTIGKRYRNEPSYTQHHPNFLVIALVERCLFHWKEHYFSADGNINFLSIVKPVLSGHSKIGKTKVLKTGFCLMQVKSIADLTWSILQYL